MASISKFTDDELSGIGIGPEHGPAMDRINDLIDKVNGMDTPSEFPYTPTTSADWSGPPTTVQGALDEAADRITTNEEDIATNVTAIGLNTTHAAGDGSDHADVATNTAAIAAIVDDHIRAVCASLPVQTDEAEVSDALSGDSGKAFVPSEIVLVVKSTSGSVAADGTINVGTSTGGAELLSAQALTGLDTAGDCRRIPLTEATFTIAADATLYANVEANDSTATTLVLDVYILGRQFAY